MEPPGVRSAKTAVVNGKKVKFIDSYLTFAVAVSCVGPLALPLFWRNPRASTQAKVVVTAVVMLVTLALVWVSWGAFKEAYKQYQEMKAMLQQSQP